ncbi:MAG: helix-turn-helix transcriptional regulator [Clostridiales bacterium]|nr:helix-turn-helix transcriptional regulator [Candidatus Apopatousia equi]
MKSNFAINHKTLRVNSKLTQPELAIKLGVSKAIISFWENDIYEPTASNIIMIAKFFDVSIDDLLLEVI